MCIKGGWEGERERERGERDMDRLLGLLRIRVLRGVDLAVRDVCSSDPYILIRMGKQKLKTSVIKKNLNPEWNEELTLSVEDPTLPIKLEVYDRDSFSFDDPMGNAEFGIQTFFEVVKMGLEGVPDGCVITKLVPNRKNCLAEESAITLVNGQVFQELVLRLRNVECGEIELQLQWISIPKAKHFHAS